MKQTASQRSERLRVERLNRGKSLAALAAEIGVSKRVLLAAEHGRVPQPANALKIASFYGCKVTDLWPLDRDDDRPAAA